MPQKLSRPLSLREGGVFVFCLFRDSEQVSSDHDLSISISEAECENLEGNRCVFEWIIKDTNMQYYDSLWCRVVGFDSTIYDLGGHLFGSTKYCHPRTSSESCAIDTLNSLSKLTCYNCGFSYTPSHSTSDPALLEH